MLFTPSLQEATARDYQRLEGQFFMLKVDYLDPIYYMMFNILNERTSLALSKP